MKKFYLILVGFSFILFSCDKINTTMKSTGTACDQCSVSDSEEFITQKSVLFEEFTAIRCTFCPDGARKAADIKLQYPEQFHIVSIHSGNLSAPDPREGYTADFRTSQGDELYKFAQPLGQPAALIDRLDFGTQDFVKLNQGSVWLTEVEAILNTPNEATIGLNATVQSNPDTRQVCLTPKFKALNDLSSRTLYWSAYLLESNIIAQQLDNGSKKETYIHNHVLRTSFNSTFGTPIPKFDGSQGSLSCDSRQISLDENWVWENCSIVIFVYDHDSYEVLQTIETHL